MNETILPQNVRSVGAVVHALRILRHLAGNGAPQGVTAISRATGRQHLDLLQHPAHAGGGAAGGV